jgi:sarcosine oxidase
MAPSHASRLARRRYLRKLYVMERRFDVIVIGLGAMGAATLDQLARRGVRALGLEQFGVAHEQGSSGGDSRLIRKAYFEHPDYVPLLERAYANWEDLEARGGEPVLFRTGIVYIGSADGEVISGTRLSARTYGLACETLTSDALRRRTSVFRVPADAVALHEPDGGFVLSTRAIRLYCEQALRNGARIRAGDAVHDWRETADGVEVTTSSRTYRADRLVISAGSWSGTLMPPLASRLAVTRQTLFWLWPPAPERFVLDAFPCWGAEVPGLAGMLYGFPMLPASLAGTPGLKIAHHFPGERCEPGQARPAVAAEFEALRPALQQILDVDLGDVIATKVCMYTSTPDHHFVVDRYPGSERVVVACGFSGHGFKFASVIGEALADLALEGRSALPIEFLGLERFVRAMSGGAGRPSDA